MNFGGHWPSSIEINGIEADGGFSPDLVLNFSGILDLTVFEFSILVGLGI